MNKTVSLLNDVVVTECVCLHCILFTNMFLSYCFSSASLLFFFALELSKILRYRPEQLHHPNVLQNLFRFSVFSIQIALNYSWWLFSFLGHCAWWIPQLWRRKSERVKHRLVHSFLSLRVSLTSGVKCSNSNSMQQRFQCHL